MITYKPRIDRLAMRNPRIIWNHTIIEIIQIFPANPDKIKISARQRVLEASYICDQDLNLIDSESSNLNMYWKQKWLGISWSKN